MTNNYDPNQKRGGPANVGNWTKYENSDPESELDAKLSALDVADHEASRVLSHRDVIPTARCGYDAITVTGTSPADQVTRRTCFGQLHNAAGPAVEYVDGREEYWSHGTQLTPPEDDCQLIGTTSSGIQEWQAGENRAVDIFPDGTQQWTRDGDFHRDGAPAIVGPRGSGWYRGGTRIPNPVPDPATIEDTNPGSSTHGFVTSTGSRYIAGREMRGVAKDVAQDLTNATRAQYLSDRHGTVSFSVKATDTTRDGRRLHIVVQGITPADMFGPNDESTLLLPAVSELRQKLQDIGDAHNKITQEKSGDGNEQDFVTDVTFQTRSNR